MADAPIDIRVIGAEKFGALARDIHKAGNTDLRKELYAALGRAAKPLGELARDEARAILPSGLGPDVADSMKIKTITRALTNPSITLEASAISRASSSWGKQKRRAVRKTRQRQKAWRLANNKATFNDIKGGQYDRPIGPKAPRKRKPKG